jgi:hypothetical protein
MEKEEKDFEFLKTQSSPDDSPTEGTLIKNYFKKLHFTFAKTGELSLQELQTKKNEKNNKSETINLEQVCYQKSFEKLPFTLKLIEQNIFLSFSTFQDYSKIVNYLKQQLCKEVTPNFENFNSKLESTRKNNLFNFFRLLKMDSI